MDSGTGITVTGGGGGPGISEPPFWRTLKAEGVLYGTRLGGLKK